MPEKLTIDQVLVATLKADPRNARTHSKQQVRQIGASIREFGFVNPILIDEANRIIAGHARRDAAAQLGLETVPVIRLSHLTEHQKRALAIADNKLAENAGWNEEVLAQELKILSEVVVDFDVTITGFAPAEIDLLIEGLAPADDPSADKIPDPEEAENIVVRRGDLFHLGRHRLLCGDATCDADFEALMSDRTAQMVITDPPYNVPIDGNVCGLGRIKHQDFVMAAGEMSAAEFTAFLEKAFSNLAAHSIEGSIHFVFMDWRHLPEILAAGEAAYSELKQFCVWVKTNAGMGSFYRSRHELVLAFKSGTAPHINNFELGQHGRHRSNVWTYAGVNSLGPDRLDELRMHPTVKPVALVADAIKDCSKRGGVILDPFAGSGTTIIAAEKTGRRAYAMELDPKYVQTAIRRWEAFTDEDAVHVETGLTFRDLCDARVRDRRMTLHLPGADAVGERPIPEESRHVE
jgi:DNA modification methylase